jgi:hypothetical protein
MTRGWVVVALAENVAAEIVVVGYIDSAFVIDQAVDFFPFW